jgi:hypothetical protein
MNKPAISELVPPSGERYKQARAARKELVSETTNWFIPRVEGWMVDTERECFLVPINHRKKSGDFIFSILSVPFEFAVNAMITMEE